MTTNHQIEVSDWTGFSFAVVSLICSLTTLLLIYLMRVWNGYLLLITSMTAFQVLYDINYILGAVPTYAACATWNFLDILGGLSVTLWTNIISFIVMFVVMKIRSFNIFRNYKYFVIIAVVFPLIIAILVLTRLEAASDDDDLPFTSCTYKPGEMSLVLRGIYYWGRLASIIFNFMVFGYTSYRVRLMAHMRAASANTQQVSVNSRESAFQVSENQTLAVFSLVSRMKYYPLAQAILRSGAAWNEFDDYRYDSFASNMMAAVCSPSTGIAYFVIFLVSFSVCVCILMIV